MIDVKFCPACGSQALYPQSSELSQYSDDPPVFKCHGCGEEFVVIEADEYAAEVTEHDALENLEAVVRSVLTIDGDMQAGSRKLLEEALP